MTTWTIYRPATALGLLLLASAIFPAGAQAPPAAPAKPARLASPEVLPDNRVTFRIAAPNATQVTLRGDWMEGAAGEKLAKDEKGVWSVTLGPLTPDIYSYSFNVDGVRTVDPSNPQLKEGVGAAGRPTTASGARQTRPAGFPGDPARQSGDIPDFRPQGE